MDKKKYYAIVPLKGKIEVFHKTWKDVEPLIKGVSLFAHRSFDSQKEADDWIRVKEKDRAESATKKKATLSTKKTLAKHELSKHEIIASQTNTKYWNAQRKLKKRVSES